MINHLFVPEENFYTHPWKIEHGHGFDRCMACGSDWYPPFFEDQHPVQIYQFIDGRYHNDVKRNGNLSCLQASPGGGIQKGSCTEADNSQKFYVFPFGAGQGNFDEKSTSWSIHTSREADSLCLESSGLVDHSEVKLGSKVNGQCRQSWILEYVDSWGSFRRIKPVSNSSNCVTLDFNSTNSKIELLSCNESMRDSQLFHFRCPKALSDYHHYEGGWPCPMSAPPAHNEVQT